MHEHFQKHNNHIKYLIKFKTAKAEGFSAQAGKPGPPGSWLSGKLSGLELETLNLSRPSLVEMVSQ